MNAMNPGTAAVVKLGAKLILGFGFSAMIGVLIKVERSTEEKFETYIDDHTVKAKADKK